MNHIKYSLLTIAGFVILAGVIVIAVPRSSMAAPPNKSVEVVNQADNPVPTYDVFDEPDIIPVGAGCVGTIPEGTAVAIDVVPEITCLTSQVPLGYRLVIEFVSVRIHLPGGQRPEVQIGTSVFALTPGTGTVGINHQIALQGITGGPNDEYAASQPVRLYSNPGSFIDLVVGRNQTEDNLIFNVRWSGYLEEL